MKVNLIRDESLTYSIWEIDEEGLMEVEVDIPEKKLKEIGGAVKQYWVIQAYLENLYEKHRKPL